MQINLCKRWNEFHPHYYLLDTQGKALALKHVGQAAQLSKTLGIGWEQALWCHDETCRLCWVRIPVHPKAWGQRPPLPIWHRREQREQALAFEGGWTPGAESHLAASIGSNKVIISFWWKQEGHQIKLFLAQPQSQCPSPLFYLQPPISSLSFDSYFLTPSAIVRQS